MRSSKTRNSCWSQPTSGGGVAGGSGGNVHAQVLQVQMFTVNVFHSHLSHLGLVEVHSQVTVHHQLRETILWGQQLDQVPVGQKTLMAIYTA